METVHLVNRALQLEEVQEPSQPVRDPRLGPTQGPLSSG